MILVKTIAGSHLFGTNTENSDMDYKGVYLPSKEQILLGEYSDTISKSTGNNDSKNSKDDVDIQMFSLKKFLWLCERGDTAAIELLFTPEQFIIEKHPLWEDILTYKYSLISKNISALIGYARHQAAKYGVKGSRLGELITFLDYSKTLSKEYGRLKLKTQWDSIVNHIKENDYKFIKLIELSNNNGVVPAVDILGKKYDYHTNIAVFSKKLSEMYKDYGQRAREARSNQGIDYKALSHAMRCIIQGKELLSTGHITLPHSGENLKLLMNIKLGKFDFDKLNTMLDEGLQ